MSRQEILRRIYTLSVSAISIIIQCIFLGTIWCNFYNPIIRIPFWTKGHYFILGIYIVVLYFFLHIYGGLKIGYLKKIDLLFSQIFSTLCADIFFYIEICLLTYGFPTPLPLVGIASIQIVYILIWAKITTSLYTMFFPPHDVLLICKQGTRDQAIQKISSRKDKFCIQQILTLSENCMPELNGIDNFSTVILWDIPSSIRSSLIKYFYEHNVRIYTNPKISDVITSGAEAMHFFDTPLFLIRNHPLSLEQLVLKRMFDIIFSIVLIIITSPIMLITAVFIKIYDHGPVFYKQERSTLDEEPFYIYKFRSMVIGAEKDGVARLSSKHDDRITPIGSFIRKVRIDELPQLFNILKGEMSFIGPRPERPSIIAEYKKSLPEFVFRTKVKAGLSGYAQIYGKYNTMPYDKLKLDLFYIEHYSLWLDIKLLILTTKILFSWESTEGIDDDKNSTD